MSDLDKLREEALDELNSSARLAEAATYIHDPETASQVSITIAHYTGSANAKAILYQAGVQRALVEQQRLASRIEYAKLAQRMGRTSDTFERNLDRIGFDVYEKLSWE